MTPLMEIRRPDFNWESMMEWWNAHSDGSHTPVSEEENLQLMEDYDDDVDVYDVVQRVHHIGKFFNYNTEDDANRAEIVGPLVSSDDGVAVLVELQELAEYVDITQELHSGHYLASLFHKVLCYKYEAGIHNKHAAVRTKAAEVVTTMVHNNPTNQQLVMDVNGLQPLLDNFISDPDVTARTKALVAISALIRKNKPGITEFRKENVGYAALRDALNSESVRFQWEALNLIQYLLNENSWDCNIVTQLGFPCIMMRLTSSDDAQVREAALRGLLVLARDEGDQLVRNDAREEIQLVDSLWNACYNEPSSLGEKRKEKKRKFRGDEDLHTTTTAITNLNSSSSEFGSFIVHVDGFIPPPNSSSSLSTLLMLSSPSNDSSESEESVPISGGGGSNDHDQEEEEVLVDDLEFEMMDSKVIVGSCNGLVCVHDRQTISHRFESKPIEVYLLDPATTHAMSLPESIPIPDGIFSMFVFGFDVETKDYKVVRFTSLKPRWNGNGSRFCFCGVQVYSLSSNSWRLLKGIPCLPGYPFPYEDSVVYLNGTCFFLAHYFYIKRNPCLSRNDRFIISFDFTKEIMTPIQLPDHHRDQNLCLCSLGDDKIALFTSTNPHLFDPDAGFGFRDCEDFNIWVLNYERGSSSSVNKNSWTKLHSFQFQRENPDSDKYCTPIGISNDGKFALLTSEYGNMMNLYNFATKELKRNFLSCRKVMSKAHAYKPSLVSVIGGGNGVGRGRSSSSSSRYGDLK